MRNASSLSRIVLVTLLVILSQAQSNTLRGGESWSGFQNGGNLSRQQGEAPSQWTPKTVAWKVNLAGYGQSSPVVQGNSVYVTSTSGAMKETLHIQAFERGTGKAIWSHQAKNSTPAKSSTYVSRAAPSPVCDESGVIALFEGGNLIALNPQGQPRWVRDLVSDYGAIAARHGLASSLEQDDEYVYAWIERQQDPYVIAVSKETGKTLWKSKGLGVTSWSSPRLVPVGKSHQLVLSGIGKVIGLDPASGRQLWELNNISGNSTPTPYPLGEGRFLIGASEGRGEAGGGRAAESNGLIQISKDDSGAYSAAFLWQAKKATSSFGSPIAHQGRAYFVSRAGVIYCLDLKTGKQLYAQRSASSVWATPIALKDLIYLFGKNGATTVLQSGDKYKQIAVNELWTGQAAAAGPAMGSPVLYAALALDGQLILRRGDTLYAVGR